MVLWVLSQRVRDGLPCSWSRRALTTGDSYASTKRSRTSKRAKCTVERPLFVYANLCRESMVGGLLRRTASDVRLRHFALFEVLEHFVDAYESQVVSARRDHKLGFLVQGKRRRGMVGAAASAIPSSSGI